MSCKPTAGAELIDTCWDVNKDNQTVNSMANAELIDTCWDVNIVTKLRINLLAYRINRYMLGCKFGNVCLTISPISELIDTCWDVNTYAVKIITMSMMN